ncbi:MAG TPA: hypothetical protein VMF58_13310 [Rhizomicrobium sp.]|nr:hypothetical protein [Rhizomicrobium sp.]
MRISVLTASAFLASVAFVTSVQAEESWSDACMKVAGAKVAEWNQARVMRDRMDTYADGSKLDTQIYFTENGMFQLIKGVWRTGQATRHQRSAGSMSSAAHTMGLTACTADGADNVDGQSALVYSYEQGPDMKSRMWVSSATGLPLRAEIDQKPARYDIPAKIVMTYAYNDDVRVPKVAQLKNDMRMKYSQDWLRYMATGTPGTSH